MNGAEVVAVRKRFIRGHWRWKQMYVSSHATSPIADFLKELFQSIQPSEFENSIQLHNTFEKHLI